MSTLPILFCLCAYNMHREHIGFRASSELLVLFVVSGLLNSMGNPQYILFNSFSVADSGSLKVLSIRAEHNK